MSGPRRIAHADLERFFKEALMAVGVPNPVEKRIRLAPAPAIAVVDSTSLPAVQSKLSPSFLIHPG